MGARKRIDYDRIEAGWRAGLQSPRQLAAAYTEETGEKVSHAAIIKHFGDRGIPRDLSAKIQAKSSPLQNPVLRTNTSVAAFCAPLIPQGSESRMRKI